MTNVKFPRKEIEKHVKLTQENIEKISLFGTPLESINDEEVEVEVFPNRPDLISLQGFLRGFKAFLGKETGLKNYKLNKPEKNYTVKIDSSVKEIRPFTVCAIVKNLSFNDERIKEIIDLQEKLHNTLGRNRKKMAIGVYPLEKIQLPIKYSAQDPKKIRFIPLESEREMNGIEILQKHPTGKEYAHLLENESLYPVFTDANDKVLSMPPIINSHETGKVTHETKEVFIECSGHHLETLQKTLNIIITTLAEMGGSVYQMNLEQGSKKSLTPDLTPQKMKISLDNANALLGLSLTEKDIEKLLPRMGYEYKNKTVLIPAWRTDILHEVDIIEDIAIAYGYNNLVPQMPQIATIAGESESSKVKSKIVELLVGLGLIEISTYHLIKHEEAQRVKSEKRIELENSKTEYKFLRPNLLIPALRILSENKDNDYPQEIFEIGTVFSNDSKGATEAGIAESENLIIASSPANITRIKQILNYLFDSLNLSYEIKETARQECIEGRTGSISLNNREIGFMGEVHPETLRDWGIKMPVAVLEIELRDVFEMLGFSR